MIYFIIRFPSTMEDEGRYFLSLSTSDLSEAEKFMKENNEEGYFRGCYILLSYSS